MTESGLESTESAGRHTADECEADDAGGGTSSSEAECFVWSLELDQQETAGEVSERHTLLSSSWAGEALEGRPMVV